MRVEDDRVAGGHDVHDVAAERWDRVGRGRDRADDAEGCIFFQRDAVIAAQAIGVQPFHARDQFDDFQLLDLMIEPANPGFLQLQPAPLDGISVSHRFDDFHRLPPRRHAFLL